MTMDIYYSKKADLFLMSTDEGVVMTKEAGEGQPGQPEMVYDDSLDNVMYEYARLGIDDWALWNTIEIKDKK